ncbi:MAG: hypothetical protein HQM12_15135 [SAR324 cluster bacterium]|nr:hypothetical protein [SAR324 cluster bacterium]
MMEIIAKALLELDLCFVANQEKITVDFQGDELIPPRKIIIMLNDGGFEMYVTLEHNPGINLEEANRFNCNIKYGNVEIWNDTRVVFKLSMPTEVTCDLIKKCFMIAMSSVTELLNHMDTDDDDDDWTHPDFPN